MDDKAATRGATVVRTLLLWIFCFLGALAAVEGYLTTQLTYATADYRPIFIRGVWSCAFAFLAFHATALLARSWRTRIPGIVGVLLALAALREILGRLAVLPK